MKFMSPVFQIIITTQTKKLKLIEFEFYMNIILLIPSLICK